MKHTNIKPKNGDIRADGKMYDGTTWRKRGINHHLNEDGLVIKESLELSKDTYSKEAT